MATETTTPTVFQTGADDLAGSPINQIITQSDVTDVFVSSYSDVTAVAGGGDGSWGEVSTIRDVAMRAVYLTLSSLGLVGNALVVIVLLTFRELRSKLTNMFIIHQSMLDFLTALFLLLTTLLPYDGRVYLSRADDVYCRIWVGRVPLWFFIHMSTYNLVLLTLERYFSVVHPILHKLSFSRMKALIGVACIWVLGIVYDIMTSTLTAKIEGGQCKQFLYPDIVTQKAVGVFSICLNYFIPIIILIYCYSRMAWTLHLRITPAGGSTITGGKPSAGAPPKAGQTQKKDSLHKRGKRNIIKTLAIVATCFILCLSWNQIFFFLFNLDIFDYTALQGNFYHFSVAAMFANCCTNPIIYTVKYEQFQMALKKIFCKKWLKQNNQSFFSQSENTATQSTVA